jgi:hypothetical protein
MARPRKNDSLALDPPMTELGLPDHLIQMVNPALPKMAQVYAMMRRAIVGLYLAPGSSVNERLICEQLGISRTNWPSNTACRSILAT